MFYKTKGVYLPQIFAHEGQIIFKFMNQFAIGKSLLSGKAFNKVCGGSFPGEYFEDN